MICTVGGDMLAIEKYLGLKQERPDGDGLRVGGMGRKEGVAPVDVGRDQEVGQPGRCLRGGLWKGESSADCLQAGH